MSPAAVLLALRLVLVALLYGFLAALFWLLWQDVRAAGRAAEGRGRPHGRLVVLESGLPELAAGAAFPLMAVTSLGRAPTNTVSLPDPTASLEHALLHLRDGQWWLEDLNSHNGTRLNEQPVQEPAAVVTGDLVSIGRVKLRVDFE